MTHLGEEVASPLQLAALVAVHKAGEVRRPDGFHMRILEQRDACSHNTRCL